jgi:hypothetical protein
LLRCVAARANDFERGSNPTELAPAEEPIPPSSAELLLPAAGMHLMRAR